LYDSPATKQTVTGVINWYKKYRDILNSDIIHLRRADGRDWDGIMHVNPQLPVKGLVMLYNPLKQKITRTIKVPLYYTGLTQSATFLEQGKSKINVKLYNRCRKLYLVFGGVAMLLSQSNRKIDNISDHIQLKTQYNNRQLSL
jgi:hypothetical protein